jgi:hypothetical protein
MLPALRLSKLLQWASFILRNESTKVERIKITETIINWPASTPKLKANKGFTSDEALSSNERR